MATAKRISFDVRALGAISSVEDFVSRCFRLRERNQNKKFLYRGQPNATHELKPTIGRRHCYGGQSMDFNPRDEIDLLHRFRRRAYPHVGRLQAGEALFFARHYGLPTRLLDWTANALYGLYFACVKDPDLDGAVWALRQQDEDSPGFTLNAFDLAAIETEDKLFRRLRPPSREQIKIVYPVFNSPRIVAQDGAFTIHSNPWRALESYKGATFRPGDVDIYALYCWLIKSDRKGPIIKELSGLGITHRIVFPDLDGIARSLWETHVLWRAKH